MARYLQPVAGELTLYLLGPGFGESVVMRLPDGETVVVDCCSDGGRCLTLELLQDIGDPDVALLILTHPDLDHVSGLNVLLSARPGQVKRVWMWPHLSLMRDLLARWGASQPSLVALAAALQSLDALAVRNACLEVTINSGDSATPQILAAGWTAGGPNPTGDPVVVLRLRADGSHDLSAQGDAGVFV